MDHLKGCTALVTGSSRGIGHAIATALWRAGADLALHGRAAGEAGAEAGEALAAEARAAGHKAEVFYGDISQRAEVEALMGRVDATFGRLDVLVLNAARAPFKPSERLLERDLRQLLDVNILGNVFCAQKALPLLSRQGGHIVFVSSLGSRYMNPEYPLGAMKAAMEQWVKQWSEEWAGRGIHVNAICGGLVKTDAFLTLRQVWPEVATLPDELFVTPEEMADVATFLTHPASRGVRGQTIVVDRGLSNRLLRSPASA